MVKAFDGVRRSWWLLTLCALALSASCGREAESAPGNDALAGAGGEAAQSMPAGGDASGNQPPAGSALGDSCTSDEQCEDGLFCLGPDRDYLDGAGSPAGGLCTLACVGDAECADFGEGAVCATLGEVPLTSAYASKAVPRLCLPGCSLGSPRGKCLNRPELACRPFAPDGVAQCEEDGSCPGGGLCFRDRCRELACGPRCNDDADCLGERKCDPVSGLCMEEAPEVPIGKSCNGDVPALSDCGGGICLALFDDAGGRVKGLCTQSCTLGQRCGNGQGACLLPRFSDYALGDIAYCQELCDADADCSNPEDVCHTFEDSELERQYGALGVCDL